MAGRVPAGCGAVADHHRRGLHVDDPAASSGLTGVLKRGAVAAAEALVPDFLPEDKAICERGQRATTGEFRPGPILEVERVVRDFHAFLQQRLA